MSFRNSEVGRTLERSRPTSSVAMALSRHCQATADVPASPDAVFEYLDDHTRLSAHMSKRSWMMAGSRMVLEMDNSNGRSVGSRIRLSGRVLGIRLCVNEIVTERNPPRRKVWETTRRPRLLVIGDYRMGFEIYPTERCCSLKVFIDYSLPRTFVGRCLGQIFGRFYARWCTQRMVKDAALHFAKK